ncbi:MAG: TrbI/VirB10 family protein [Cyanobacteria bacterium P01_G01_bin.38]
MNSQENLWDEQGMADLVGLQLSESSENPDQEPVSAATDNESSHPPEPLLDPEDLEDTPAAGASPKRRLSLAANPFTKLGVVAAGTGLVIGVLAVFTNSVMNGGDPKTAEEPQADFPDPMVESDEDSARDDRGELLTDLALGNQQAELEALSEEAEPPQPEPADEAETPQFSPAPSPAPRPVQPVAQRAAPVPRVSSPVPRMTPAAPAPQAQPAPIEPEVDPMERWMALSHIGSYGRPVTGDSTGNNTPIPPREDTLSEDPVQLAQADTSSAPTIEQASVKTSSAPAINRAEEAAILDEEPIHAPTLMTGTQAAAVLVTPLIWAEATAEDSLQFVVQLTEPLLSPDEEVGLPTDAQLVAQVQSVDESGLARLAVVSIIQEGQEIPLPENTIQFRGENGTPLIAEEYDDRGSSTFGRDLNSALIAGVARAAELINAPESSSVVTNTGGSVVTQENGDSDILAGVLEGAFGELTERMTERNQAALEESQDRPTIWYLSPGTEIEVFINRTVAL